MNMYEAEELAIAVLGLCENSESDDIENAIFNRFDVDLSTFTDIAQALIPFTTPAQAAITGKMYQGFVKDNAFIVKKELA